MTLILELLDQEFKNYIKCAKGLNEKKVDNMQEQMGNANREKNSTKESEENLRK